MKTKAIAITVLLGIGAIGGVLTLIYQNTNELTVAPNTTTYSPPKQVKATTFNTKISTPSVSKVSPISATSNYIPSNTTQAWQLSMDKKDSGVTLYRMTMNREMMNLRNQQVIVFETPQGAIKFNLLVKSLPDLKPLSSVDLEKNQMGKITALNFGNHQRQTLDMAFTSKGEAIGSIEDGDKFYVFHYSKYGEGKLIEHPKRVKGSLLDN